MKSWWKRVSSGWDKQSRAEREVAEAQCKVEDVTGNIRKSVETMERQLMLQQGMLQRALQQGAPRSALVDLTKKVQQLQRDLAKKKRLVGNMGREGQQLNDAYTNAQVAAAMMRSVEAQKKMQKLWLGGRDADEMDEILDDIEEHRDATADLTDRLAAKGGDDEADIFDEDAFCDEDIMAALGMNTRESDTELLTSTRRKMAEGWQNLAEATPTKHFNIDPAAPMLNTTTLPHYGAQASPLPHPELAQNPSLYEERPTHYTAAYSSDYANYTDYGDDPDNYADGQEVAAAYAFPEAPKTTKVRPFGNF